MTPRHAPGTDLNTGEAFNPWAGLRETPFQQAVHNFAHAHGWIVAHFRTVKVERAGGRPSYHATAVQFDGAGWPDLVLVRAETVLFRELKTDSGSPSPEQIEWLERLAAAGADVGIWRPRDYAEIVAVLQAGSTYRTRQQIAEELAWTVPLEAAGGYLYRLFRARVADVWTRAKERTRKHGKE